MHCCFFNPMFVVEFAGKAFKKFKQVWAFWLEIYLCWFLNLSLIFVYIFSNFLKESELKWNAQEETVLSDEKELDSDSVAENHEMVKQLFIKNKDEIQ